MCEACGAGQQQGGGELIPVGADIVAMAQCDGQHLGHIAPLAANENAVPAPQTRDGAHDHASARTNHADGDAGETADHAHAHVGAPDRVDADTDDPAPQARAPHPDPPVLMRATQPTPPALRRAVLVRDQRCCRVPGCKNRAFLDLHHIELRSEGGGNVIWNILTLCGAHHRATHQGTLLIEHDGSGGVRFYHGDGTPYGQALEPQALDVQTRLFTGLRNMGFKESEVRAVLAELRQDDALRAASIQDLLRESLRRIRPPRRKTEG